MIVEHSNKRRVPEFQKAMVNSLVLNGATEHWLENKYCGLQ